MRSLIFTYPNFRSVLVLTLALLIVVSGSLSVTPPPPVHACNTCNFQLTWGSYGVGDGEFYSPQGVAVDSTSGNVYVTDTNNYRVEKFSGFGSSFVGWAGACTGGTNCVGSTHSNGFTCTASTCTGVGTGGSGNGQFSFPKGVAVDSSGNVYVADQSNNRVEKFTSAGTYITAWGCPTAGTGCSIGSGDGEFHYPQGVAVDPTSGNVYVVDYGNNRVEKFSNAGVFDGWAGGCTSGSNCVSGTSIGFMCTLATCGAPASGTGPGQFSSSTGVAVDSSGNVYVADNGNNRVEKSTSAGTYITAWGCTNAGTSSCPNSATPGQFDEAFFVAVDSSGNVYVTDIYNYRVEKFDSSGSFLLTWGSHGTGNGEFNGPSGVAVDSAGNVYVTDSYSTSTARVEKFGDPTTSITVTSSPTGSGFVTVDGTPAATPAMFGWTIGSKHNLTASSSVISSGAQYVWMSWSDGGARSHNITVPSVPTTYTANFKLTAYVGSVSLVTGWNLISLPIVPSNTVIGNVLSGLIAASNFSVIWSYQGGAWKSFTPPSTGTLTTMQDGFGYWIYVIRPSTLLVPGYTIPPPQGNPSKYVLSSGWNLVGFKPQSPTQDETVGAYLTTISGKYSIAGIYDNVNATWIVANPEVQLAPGEALWIYMTAPATLVPPI